MINNIKEEKREVKKLSAKRWLSYFILAVCVIIVYKIFDNFGNVQEWFVVLLKVLKPFLVGIFIAYILMLPCRKIEKIFVLLFVL